MSRRHIYGLLFAVFLFLFGAGNVFSAYDENAFVTKWTATGTVLKMKLFGTGIEVRVYVAGQPEGTFVDATVNADNLWEKTVTKGTTYIVEFKGLTGFRVISTSDIQTVERWGTSKWKTLKEAFSGCSKLDIAPTVIPPHPAQPVPNVPDLSICESVVSMFKDCSSLQNINAKDWKVGNITHFTSMFDGCLLLAKDNLENQGFKEWKPQRMLEVQSMFKDCKYFDADLSAWKTYTEHLTSLYQTFSGCSAFAGMGLKDWNVSNVENFANAFYGCEKFEEPIGGWNTGKATSMRAMFAGCSLFNKDISKWKVKKVTDFVQMFYGCTLFNQDLSAWLAPGDPLGIGNAGGNAAVRLDEMFGLCKQFNVGNKLEGLDGWDVSGVTSMYRTFYMCKNFNKPLNGWKVGNVKTMQGLFEEAEAFNQSLSKWDVSNVKSLHKTFRLCRAFNQDMSGWAGKTGKVTDFREMFANCDAFVGTGLDDWDVSRGEIFENMFFQDGMFEGNLSKWVVGNATTFNSMFFQCKKFESDLSRWRPVKVTTMASMFAYCAKFKSELNGWRTPVNLSLYQTFYECTEFNSSLEDWDVSQVRDFGRMFYKAIAFNQDLKKWNTERGENFKGMFSQAYSFESDLSQWNVSRATNMSEMFLTARKFKSDLSQWNVSNVTDMSSMFAWTDSFNSDLTKWDVSKVKNMTKMFRNALAFDCSLGTWVLSSLESELTLEGSGMGIANYDRSLIGWNESNVKNITVNAKYLKFFSDEANTAHTTLSGTTKNWSITDAGRTNAKKIQLAPAYDIELDNGKVYSGGETLTVAQVVWKLIQTEGGVTKDLPLYEATWTPLDPTIVSVEQNKTAKTFKLKALKPGRTIIKVSVSGAQVYDEWLVNVVILVSDLNFSQEKYEIPLGQKLDLSKELTILPNNASNKKVLWESEDNNVVSIDPETGVATAKNDGETQETWIKVTSLDRPEGKRISQRVKVVAKRIKTEKVEAEPQILYVKPGATVDLKAVLTPENATNQVVNWTSSNPARIEVTDPVNGKIHVKETPDGPYVVDVFVEQGALKSTCRVNVLRSNDIVPTSIILLPKTLELMVGESRMLTWTISPSNTPYKEVGWLSSNPDVVSIQNGRVVGLAKGTADIVVRSHTSLNVFDQIEVTVNEIAVTGVDIDKTASNYHALVPAEDSYFEIPVNIPSSIPYIIDPEVATNKAIEYEIDDAEVVSVVQGKLVGKLAGQTTRVRLKALGGSNVYSPYFKIKVVDNKKPTGLSIPQDLILNPRDMGRFPLTYIPADATDRLVSWKSTDPQVLKVLYDGSYEALQAGTAKVTVSLVSDPTIKGECNVRVLQRVLPDGLNMIRNITIGVGNSYRFAPEVTPLNATDQRILWKVLEGADKIEFNEQELTVKGSAAGTAKIEASLRAKPDVKVECVINVTATATPAATQIRFKEATIEVEEGKSKDVELVIEPEGATPLVTYTSDNPTYVVVAASKEKQNAMTVYGRLYSAGQLITVRGGGDKSFDMTVKVIQAQTPQKPAPTSFEVDSELTIVKGGVGIIEIKGVNPETHDIEQLMWSPLTGGIHANVTKTGIVRATNTPGDELVTIANGGFSKTVTVHVIDPDAVVDVASFDVEQTEMTLYLDANGQNGEKRSVLLKDVTPANALPSTLVWTRKTDLYPNNVFDVDVNGVVTALKEGEQILVVKTKTTPVVEKEVKIVVTKRSTTPPAPTKPALTAFSAPTDPISVMVNNTTLAKLNLTPADADVSQLTWTASPSDRASVNNNGEIKGLKAGKVTITVTHPTLPPVTFDVMVVDPSQPQESTYATGFGLVSNTLTVVMGSTGVIELKDIVPAGASTDKLVWEELTPAICKVANGKVTPVSVSDNGQVRVSVEGTPELDRLVVTVKVLPANATDPATDPNGPKSPLESFAAPTTQISLTVGNTTTVKLNVTPLNADLSKLNWTSSRSGVATVNNDGVITGVAVGKTTITVTNTDKPADPPVTFEVVVVAAPKPALNSFDKPENPVNVLKDNPTTLPLKTDPANADTSGLEWSSSDTDVATIDKNTGVITGHKGGTTTITVKDPNDPSKTVSFDVTVVDPSQQNKPALNDFDKPENPVSVVKDNPTTVPLKLDPVNGDTSKLEWSSADENIATVDKHTGVITGKSSGTVKITVKDPATNKEVSFDITVVDPSQNGGSSKPALERFSVVSSTVVVVQNYRSVVLLQLTPADADISRLRWESDDSSIATVEGGVITGVSVGETEVTVTDEQTATSYSITVTVVSDNSITSVEDAALAQVVVAPNPFVGFLRIQSVSALVEDYALLSVNGQVVRAGRVAGSETVVETEDLPAGLYLLRLRAANGASRTLRVVKR